jgi:hypothetical protein
MSGKTLKIVQKIYGAMEIGQGTGFKIGKYKKIWCGWMQSYL